MDQERGLIADVLSGREGAVKVASIPTRTTVALALNRLDFMPDDLDTLTAYMDRLDDRQRAIVSTFRGWDERTSFTSPSACRREPDVLQR